MTTETYGKYEVIARIGEGGFGEVFQGRDPDLKRAVAIKTCKSTRQDLVDRFLREAEISAKLQHPNIVIVYDFGFHGDTPYLVQELLPGHDLDHLIKQRHPLDLATRLGILRQAATALSFAHSQGVIHRDVKPANVRLLDDGRVKILDFGIAKLLHAEVELTQTGMTLGTAGYLPPEQLKGATVDHRADIFSFGVMAYELMTYRRPFEGTSLPNVLYLITHEEPEAITERWPGCPPQLARCIHTCLAKDPSGRYPGFPDVLKDLEATSTASLALASGAIVTGPPATGAAASGSIADEATRKLGAGVPPPPPPSGPPPIPGASGPPPPPPPETGRSSFLSRAYDTVLALPRSRALQAAAVLALLVGAFALGNLWRGTPPPVTDPGGENAAGTGPQPAPPTRLEQPEAGDSETHDVTPPTGQSAGEQQGPDIGERSPDATAVGRDEEQARRLRSQHESPAAPPPQSTVTPPPPQAPPPEPATIEPPPPAAVESQPPAPAATSLIPPPAAGRGVTLYDQRQFRGTSELLTGDDPDLRDNRIGHDAVSSVRVDPGCRAILFQDVGYLGPSAAISFDTERLNGTRLGNNEASSVRVMCSAGGGYGVAPPPQRGVVLFLHSGHQGAGETFTADDPDLADNRIGKGTASSIRLAPGCRATLYRRTQYRGRSSVVTRDLSNLRGTEVGNDAVASIRVVCR